MPATLHHDEAGAAALDRLVGFGRFLRANGLNVGTGRSEKHTSELQSR